MMYSEYWLQSALPEQLRAEIRRLSHSKDSGDQRICRLMDRLDKLRALAIRWRQTDRQLLLAAAELAGILSGEHDEDYDEAAMCCPSLEEHYEWLVENNAVYCPFCGRLLNAKAIIGEDTK